MVVNTHRLKDYGREGQNESFDWFKSYADLSELLHTLIPNKSSRILMLGCGNSTLSEEVGLKPVTI
jgi:EEF1A lysine methyltransferase 4